VNRKTETKQTSSKEEDSFEQARQTFFGTGEKIMKPNLSSADSSKRETILSLQHPWFFPLWDIQRECGTWILYRVAPHIVASIHQLMCQREDLKDWTSSRNRSKPNFEIDLNWAVPSYGAWRIIRRALHTGVSLVIPKQPYPAVEADHAFFDS
jgi:hypothetical protein